MFFYFNIGYKFTLKLFQRIWVFFCLHFFNCNLLFIVFTVINLASTTTSNYLYKFELIKLNDEFFILDEQIFQLLKLQAIENFRYEWTVQLSNLSVCFWSFTQKRAKHIKVRLYYVLSIFSLHLFFRVFLSLTKDFIKVNNVFFINPNCVWRQFIFLHPCFFLVEIQKLDKIL